MTSAAGDNRRGRSARRALLLGLVLIALAVASYATTYGPRGTMTSVALAAMAAYALAALGAVAVTVAVVLTLRR